MVISRFKTYFASEAVDLPRTTWLQKGEACSLADGFRLELILFDFFLNYRIRVSLQY